jgi:hypothetical protein
MTERLVLPRLFTLKPLVWQALLILVDLKQNDD